jgi:small subunit ribosomal protein S4
LNGIKTNIPSALVKEGDTIGWMERSTKTEYFKELQATIESRTIPGWLILDRKNMTGQVQSLPTPDDIEVKIDGKAIVEHYSR